MEILEKILTDKANRKQLICEFQELVWNDENASEILSELAYDLDFYEPNEEWRKEDPSYYGEERLEQEIKTVIQKLQEQSPI
ncbi:MAG: hypothetical protein K1X26_12150 [Chitinophagales bacterium]|jgi:hypothetical protein|nr:hypothetical protein [Chitinophagales bacterium]HNK91341.1 hypothetical protein [Chitinophagales bacterium]